MKNNKKKSPMMKIVSAAAMLAVSASMLGTSTYAWFTLNNSVSVSGMELKAAAEGGLVITNEAGTDWKATAVASHSGSGIAVRPTSTINATNWYHAISDDINDAKASQAAGKYTSLTTAVDSTSGVGYVDDDTTSGYSASDSKYYLKNMFYIKSSEAASIDASTNTLSITNVKATLPETAGSANLDPAFRVAIVIGGETKVFAPVSGATLSYVVAGNNSNAVTATDSSATGACSVATAVATIPGNTATTANAVPVAVYLYFEGEDANCKSANLTTTLDNISVEVGFSLANYPNYS